MSKLKTKLYCHNCNSNFIVTLNMELTGNHEIICPICKHIHYRVVENGEVTGERYRSSLLTFSTTTTLLSSSSTATVATDYYCLSSWCTSVSLNYG